MKKILYLLSITFLILQSCSSGDSSEDGSDNPIVGEGPLLKKIVNSDGEIINYFYNGNKISKITWTGSTYDPDFYLKFTYTGDLITKIEYGDNEGVEDIETIYYENNKIKQVKSYRGQSVPYDITDYIYNNDGTITEIERDFNTNEITDGCIYKLYYNTEGNVYKMEKDEGGGIRVYNYQFDSKNNPFKNIVGMYELTSPALYFNWAYLLFPTFGSPNNLIEIETNEPHYNINASYRYNSLDLPISANFRNGEGYVYSSTYYYY